MGNGRLSASDWGGYVDRHVAGKTREAVFTSRSLAPEYDPAMIEVRESRDGAHNPSSTAIALACDVTGSMGMVAHELMKTGIPKIAEEIYDRKPVTDPHIMVMAIGDATCDQAPLQATQFEADISLAEQIRALWLEGGGGGNRGESYSGAHLFAGFKTSIDCFEKRRRKGYLFTIGDEPNLDGMTRDEIKRAVGVDVEKDLTAAECLEIAARQYEVFHVVLNAGYASRPSGMAEVLATWKPILPQRTIVLDDPTKLAEVVVSTIQVNEGANRHDVARSWSGDTSLVVANAIRDLAAAGTGTGVQRLG